MFVCRTPFRISLFGGGTDFPEWFNSHNGATISFAIDKYCYVTLRKLPQLYTFKYRLRYFKSEMAQSISQIRHPSIKGAISTFDRTKDSFEIVHSSDIPGLSGLGSSSAFSVSIINLIQNYNNIYISENLLSIPKTVISNLYRGPLMKYLCELHLKSFLFRSSFFLAEFQVYFIYSVNWYRCVG